MGVILTNYRDICELRGYEREGAGCTRYAGLRYCGKRSAGLGTSMGDDCTTLDAATLSDNSTPYPTGAYSDLSLLRIDILERLAAGIEAVNGAYPADDPSPPTIGAPTVAASVPAVSKVVSAMHAPHDGHYYPLYDDRFTMYGAEYFGGNIYLAADANYLVTQNVTPGDGSDPSLYSAVNGGPKLRFTTDAPQFDLPLRLAPSVFNQPLELRVNGLKVPTRFGRAEVEEDNFGLKYVNVKFGDGSNTYRASRNIEVLAVALESTLPGGVVVDAASTVVPWPQLDTLKVGLFGDSFTELGMGLELGDIIGQANTWPSGLGGTGWFADSGGGRSDAVERWPYDILGKDFDVLFDFMGLNDSLSVTSAAQYTARMLPSYAALLAEKPETIIILTGPMSNGSAANANVNLGYIRDGKRALAALFPQNAIFIDNIQEAWIYGTGNVDNPQGDGNADIYISADGTHPVVAGNKYLGQKTAAGVALGIPALLALQ